MSIAAHIVCTVDKGSEVFTLSISETNPNGLTVTDRSHTDGQVVNNEAFTVTWTYVDNRGDEQTATADVVAVDGCLPDRQTMSIQAHIICTVDKGTEVFTLSITETNPDGLTVTDRSHTDGQVVDNEAFTVTWTYVDNLGDEQTATYDVVAVDGCLPDDPGTMTIAAHLVCTPINDGADEEFHLVITETNPDGLSVTDRSHVDGEMVDNVDFTVTWTYVDGNGDEQTATADVVAIPGCKIPDGDWAEKLSSPGGIGLSIGSVLLLVFLFGRDVLAGRRRASIV